MSFDKYWQISFWQLKEWTQQERSVDKDPSRDWEWDRVSLQQDQSVCIFHDLSWKSGKQLKPKHFLALSEAQEQQWSDSVRSGVRSTCGLKMLEVHGPFRVESEVPLEGGGSHSYLLNSAEMHGMPLGSQSSVSHCEETWPAMMSSRFHLCIQSIYIYI